jgi:hypothetical protein
VLERVVVALESCGSAYFHEEGDDRLLDCGLELWDLDPRSSRASALPVPEGVTDASLVPMAASASLVRLSVDARVLDLVRSAGGWKPVAAGSGAGCDLGDGTLVAVGADGAVERLSGEASEWRQIAEVPAPTGPITTLQCGPGVAYRTSVGRLPVVVVDQEGVRVVPSPVTSATEVPGWVVDQVSGDLLLLGGRGIAARLPPDGVRFEELDVPMDRYEPSSGGGVRKPRAAELLDLDVHPDGTLVLGRF